VSGLDDGGVVRTTELEGNVAMPFHSGVKFDHITFVENMIASNLLPVVPFYPPDFSEFKSLDEIVMHSFGQSIDRRAGRDRKRFFVDSRLAASFRIDPNQAKRIVDRTAQSGA
jgi:hypothetical protein